jgi:hypothetical protein
MHTLFTLIWYSAWSVSQSNRQEKEIKGTQIGNKKVKLFLFADDMILYLKDSKDSTRKLRSDKHHQESSRIQVNIKRLVTFLHNNN